ncbi:MAG: fused MFS/spermidine synthase [Gemmataceae bacterium]|nr:fused MFS/spermidine synthase [Gemmata sp.]MDW8197702.1 fused MFS/spermidine synthase [Gemmataceae bacterium]
MLPALYATTLFVGAALLFLVQPMIGKLLLPLVGGTPSVWNTCMVFFQAVLLAGYLYAHRSTWQFGVRRQAVVHLLLLIVVVTTFWTAVAATGAPVPVAASLLPDDQDSSFLVFVQLATVVGIAVGVPFFVLSTTSPLLQRWFAATGHHAARDPYFLYAASNAGSLLGLLAYPLVIEPQLTLAHQQWVFAGGVMGYVGLVTLCATTVFRAHPEDPPRLTPVAQPVQECAEAPADAQAQEKVREARVQAEAAARCIFEQPALPPPPSDPPDGPRMADISPSRVLRWVFLAMLPSSLLLGVTTHVSTDLAPVPLLWVVPLALYLISFILVFARWPQRLHRWVGRVTPMLILFVVLTLLTYAAEPLALVGLLHMAAFFGVCLVCHGELAQDRPPAIHLTAFYFWMSVGGVLGGLFNALIAPMIFRHLGMIEYPLALVLAAAIRPRTDHSAATLRLIDGVLVAGLLVVAMLLVLWVPEYVPVAADAEASAALTARLLRGGLMYGLPAVLAFALVRRPLRYSLALAALFLAGAFDTKHFGETLHMERNFYGVIRVTRSPDGQFIRLIHGTTIHGQQRVDEPGRPRPMTYYHERGPVGHIFAMLEKRHTQKLENGKAVRVGVVGLGTGAVAHYARAGQEWVFFEIDPAVVRVARDERYFRFLADCQGTCAVVLGDARRQLTRVADAAFDILIIDGFCSDAIPVHLLTREAIALYVRKLAEHGIILMHVSNNHLDLPPLIRRLAENHDPPLVVRYCRDFPTDAERADGKTESQWMLLARSEADIAPIVAYGPVPPPAKKHIWEKVPLEDGVIWRDDFVNLLRVWKKRED